jgi:hypothetical protein
VRVATLASKHDYPLIRRHYHPKLNRCGDKGHPDVDLAGASGPSEQGFPFHPLGDAYGFHAAQFSGGCASQRIRRRSALYLPVGRISPGGLFEPRAIGQLHPVLAQKYVGPGKQATADGFFTSRIETRARLRPRHCGRAAGAIAVERRVCRTQRASTPKPATITAATRGLSRATFVAMMQTADLWEGNNGTCRGWLYRTRLWTILG